MSEVIRINKTGQAVAATVPSFFCERASFTHVAAATLRIYDGTSGSDKLVAVLGCPAGGADQQIINYNFKNGVYSEMTTTGTGFGAGFLHQR